MFNGEVGSLAATHWLGPPSHKLPLRDWQTEIFHRERTRSEASKMYRTPLEFAEPYAEFAQFESLTVHAKSVHHGL